MIDSILESLNDPHSRHAILTHFPIVLGALGVIPAAILAGASILKRRQAPTMSWVCIVWFASAAVSLGLASGAGEEAYERVEASTPRLTEAEENALHEHESLGEAAWLWALPSLAGAGLTIIPKRKIQIISGVATLVTSIVLAGFVAVAGHTGGLLVYEQGLGVPARSVTTPISIPSE